MDKSEFSSKRRALVKNIPILAAIFGLQACVQFQVKEKDLLLQDAPPESAKLVNGMQVTRTYFEHSGRQIAVSIGTRPNSEYIIIYCGGNAFRVDQDGGPILESLSPYADVVMFDYSGIGRSSGRSSVANLKEDGHALYRFLSEQSYLKNKKIIIHGFSMGGFVAAEIASRHLLHGLILESTAADVKGWVDSLVPLLARPFVRINVDQSLLGLDNVEVLRSVNVPILLLAAEKDEQTRISVLENLFTSLSLAHPRTRFERFDKVGHGEVLQHPHFASVLNSYLQSLAIGK